MNQAFNLFRLQKIDTQLDLTESRLAEITRALETDEQLNQAEKALSGAKQQLELAKKALTASEDRVQAQRTKIETSESALYGGKIHNPKELQDLQNEITALKRHLIEFEDEQLEKMLALEDVEKMNNEAEAKLLQAQANHASQNASLIGEQSQLLKSKENLLVERKSLLGSISSANLEIYNRLRQEKKGVALATIQDDACSACGSTVRPAELQAARSPNQIAYCSSCGRIIYAG